MLEARVSWVLGIGLSKQVALTDSVHLVIAVTEQRRNTSSLTADLKHKWMLLAQLASSCQNLAVKTSNASMQCSHTINERDTITTDQPLRTKASNTHCSHRDSQSVLTSQPVLIRVAGAPCVRNCHCRKCGSIAAEQCVTGARYGTAPADTV